MLGDFRLKVFEALSATGSFTRAAEQLGISQPAVSQNIAELEKDLGVRLFERGRSEVSLTPQGRAFRSYAGKILYWYDSARMIFGPHDSSRLRTVRICASGSLAGEPVAALVSAMTASFPGTVFMMHESPETFPEDGFGFRLEECAGGHSGPIWAEACNVGYSYPAAVVSPVSRTVYSSFSSWQDIPSGIAVADGCTDGLVPFEEISHKIVFRSPSAEAVKSLVKSSPGIVGLLPRHAARNELSDKSLLRISLPDMHGAPKIINMIPSKSFSGDIMCSAAVNILTEIFA